MLVAEHNSTAGGRPSASLTSGDRPLAAATPGPHKESVASSQQRAVAADAGKSPSAVHGDAWRTRAALARRNGTHRSPFVAPNQLPQRPGRSQAAMSEAALEGPPAAVVSGANRGLGLEVRNTGRSTTAQPLPRPTAIRRRCRRQPSSSPALALLPQLCRQLRQRGWRVVALCRSSSAELDALSTPPAGATNQQQADGESGGSLTVVQGIDVSSDGCVALLQVRMTVRPFWLQAQMLQRAVANTRAVPAAVLLPGTRLLSMCCPDAAIKQRSQSSMAYLLCLAGCTSRCACRAADRERRHFGSGLSCRAGHGRHSVAGGHRTRACLLPCQPCTWVNCTGQLPIMRRSWQLMMAWTGSFKPAA